MKNLFLILIATLLIALPSCKKASYLNSETAEITAPVSGLSDTVILHSDANKYSVDSVPAWVQTVLNDSVLIVTVKNNDTKAQRKGNIVIVNDDLKLIIPVVQQYKATHLNLPEGNTLKLSKEGGVASIPVDCDGEIVIEGGDGMNLSMKEDRLTVTAEKNTGGAVNRTVKLIANDFSEEVKVILEGDICLTCNGAGVITCPTCKGRGWYSVPNSDCGNCCQKCGGSGYSYPAPGGWAFTGKKGKGKITCPDCKGKGK